MKIIRTKFMSLIGKKAFTTPWAIYAAPKAKLSEVDIHHESIHTAQCKELWYIGFMLWYVIEWIIRLPKGDAYRNISFEREAYDNEKNLNYLKNRKRFTFLKYL